MWNERTISSGLEGTRPRKQESADCGLAAQAAAELRRSSYADLRRVVCEFRDGALTLSGCVSSYYQKQIAQALVQFRLQGVVVRNELEVFVRRPDESAMVCAEQPSLA
jgi:osmotically-inducible protein OsmY